MGSNINAIQKGLPGSLRRNTSYDVRAVKTVHGYGLGTII